MQRTGRTALSRISARSVTAAVRWSFALDVLWLGTLALPTNSVTIADWKIALGIALVVFSANSIIGTEARWDARISKIRSVLATPVGGVVLGLFAAGLTIEILGYLAAIFKIDPVARVAVAVTVGLTAARLKDRLLASYVGAAPGVGQPATQGISGVLVGAIALRIAGASSVCLAPGPLRWLCWLACVLNTPQEHVGARSRPVPSPDLRQN